MRNTNRRLPGRCFPGRGSIAGRASKSVAEESSPSQWQRVMGPSIESRTTTKREGKEPREESLLLRLYTTLAGSLYIMATGCGFAPFSLPFYAWDFLGSVGSLGESSTLPARTRKSHLPFRATALNLQSGESLSSFFLLSTNDEFR